VKTSTFKKPKMSDSESEDENMVVEDQNDEAGECSGAAMKKEPRQVYLPGHQMQEDESLVFDPSAYHMLHDIDSGTFDHLGVV